MYPRGWLIGQHAVNEYYSQRCGQCVYTHTHCIVILHVHLEMPTKNQKLLAGQQTITRNFLLAASAVAEPSSATLSSSLSDSKEHCRGKGDVKHGAALLR